MTNDRILQLLGLCRRAGRLKLGSDAAVSSAAQGEARLLLCAEDISENTRKKIKSAADMYGVKFFTLNRTKDSLSAALGKFCTVVAVNDSGFAKKLIGYIQTESEE